MRNVVAGIVLIGAIAATPAFAQESRRQRERDQRGQQGQDQGERRGGRNTGDRAVPRESVRPNDAPRQSAAPPQGRYDARPQGQPDAWRNDRARRGADSRRRDDNRRHENDGRYNDNRRYDNDGRHDDNRRGPGRTYYPYYSNRGYGSRVTIVPRYVRPIIVTVVPYRPYRYRPSIGIGIYYGMNGAYPYGYTPRGYYDPIPGRAYGGLRIVGASPDAQVFADGYYVGIANDFDGIFQHVNLEAGPHRIEIVEPGYEDQSIQFDVMVQPGRTTTFRADTYRY